MKFIKATNFGQTQYVSYDSSEYAKLSVSKAREGWVLVGWKADNIEGDKLAIEATKKDAIEVAERRFY